MLGLATGNPATPTVQDLCPAILPGWTFTLLEFGQTGNHLFIVCHIHYLTASENMGRNTSRLRAEKLYTLGVFVRQLLIVANGVSSSEFRPAAARPKLYCTPGFWELGQLTLSLLHQRLQRNGFIYEVSLPCPIIHPARIRGSPA